MDGLKQIIISGSDAEKFLQNQLTCDVKNITNDRMQLSAVCNVKGRVIATVKANRLQESFQLILPEETAPIVNQHFQKYILFSKIFITMQNFNKTASNWRQEDIKKGIPNIYPQTSERFTPHMLNLPQLGAVSFNKGCYLGQEIIARSEHLGKVKRHLYFTAIKTSQLPKPGDEVKNDKQYSIGTVIDAVIHKNKTLLLAVIQDEYAIAETNPRWSKFTYKVNR